MAQTSAQEDFDSLTKDFSKSPLATTISYCVVPALTATQDISLNYAGEKHLILSSSYFVENSTGITSSSYHFNDLYLAPDAYPYASSVSVGYAMFFEQGTTSDLPWSISTRLKIQAVFVDEPDGSTGTLGESSYAFIKDPDPSNSNPSWNNRKLRFTYGFEDRNGSQENGTYGYDTEMDCGGG